MLRQEWKVQDFKAGLEVFNRIGLIAEKEGHHPDLHLVGNNAVAAELSTHSLGEWLTPSMCSVEAAFPLLCLEFMLFDSVTVVQAG